MKTCAEIVARCLSGGMVSRQNITATVIRATVVSPFACFCEFHVDPKEKDPPTRFGQLLAKWGRELEQKYVDSVDPNARQKQFSYNPTGFETFAKAAVAGDKYIYNPPLFYLSENLAGKPDLLVRDDSASSAFGKHHYRITEIKFSSRFEERNKRHYLLQAVFYNHLLGKVQEYLPPRFTMIDRHGTATDFNHAAYAPELDRLLVNVEAIRSGSSVPEPIYNTCADAYWENHCDAKAQAARDVSLVSRLSDKRIRDQLTTRGIRTVDQLAQTDVAEIAQLKWVRTRAEFFSQQAKSLASGNEIIVQRVVLPSGMDTEVYLDVEDTGYVHPTVPHYVFLIGAAVRRGKDLGCHHFLAESETDVGKVVNQFLTFLKTSAQID